MGTPWSEVITNSAMVVIDDVRLQEDAAVNPAQFLRRMSLYMDVAIPMLTHPPELAERLTEGMVKAEYADFEWTSTEESMEQETVVETEKTGFDLCSCVIRRTSARGNNVTYVPYPEVTYDPETGAVTFPAQEAAGVEYMLDFYKDGEFAEDLTARQMRLLGMAIACVWDERFSRNWLNMQMKVHDQSFDVVNESNYIKETTARTGRTRAAFYDELRKYEQDCAYMGTVPQTKQAKRLL